MKPNALNSAIVAVLSCCIDLLAAVRAKHFGHINA
jgi:hypothetical protein